MTASTRHFEFESIVASLTEETSVGTSKEDFESRTTVSLAILFCKYAWDQIHDDNKIVVNMN